MFETLLCQIFFLPLTVQRQRKASLLWLSPVNMFINHTLASFLMTALYSLGNYESFFWLSDISTILRKNLSWYCLIPFHPNKLYLKYNHPILVKILELYMKLTRDGKKIVFIWVPGHVDIRGNLAADTAAKDALDGNILVELIPFLYLKTCTYTPFRTLAVRVGWIPSQ